MVLSPSCRPDGLRIVCNRILKLNEIRYVTTCTPADPPDRRGGGSQSSVTPRAKIFFENVGLLRTSNKINLPTAVEPIGLDWDSTVKVFYSKPTTLCFKSPLCTQSLADIR